MSQKQEIQTLLREKRVSQSSIAKALGLSASQITNVISGRDRNERIEKAITKITGYEFPRTFKSDEEVKEMLEGVI